MSPPFFFNKGAEQYVPETFPKAQSSLQAAENMLARDSGKNKVTSGAHQTIEFVRVHSHRARPLLNSAAPVGVARCMFFFFEPFLPIGRYMAALKPSSYLGCRLAASNP